MGKLSGQKFDMVSVLYDTGKRHNKHIVYKCLCDCGKSFEQKGFNITTKHFTSCGCSKKSMSEVIGKRFGRLTVLFKVESFSRNGNVVYEAVCDCGTQTRVTSRVLTSGSTKSCGCLNKEVHTGQNCCFYKHGESRTPEYVREKGRRNSALRRVRKLHAVTETFTDEKLNEKLSLLGNKCVYCDNGSYEAKDHLIPLTQGGNHSVENLFPSCKSCNSSKHNKILFHEWMPPKVDKHLFAAEWFEYLVNLKCEQNS